MPTVGLSGKGVASVILAAVLNLSWPVSVFARCSSIEVSFL